MTVPKTDARIVNSDDTLKVEQTDALPKLMNGVSKGLWNLVAEHEETATEPVRLKPGPPPLYVPIEELWVLEEQEKVREIYASMVSRARIAAATQEFYEPSTVRHRARFDKSDQTHYVATLSWVSRLSVAPALALTRFARDAVATGNVALAAPVIENAQDPQVEIPDIHQHGH
jgi:hypothetical protein